VRKRQGNTKKFQNYLTASAQNIILASHCGQNRKSGHHESLFPSFRFSSSWTKGILVAKPSNKFLVSIQVCYTLGIAMGKFVSATTTATINCLIYKIIILMLSFLKILLYLTLLY
jgi:hypothetical protein